MLQLVGGKFWGPCRQWCTQLSVYYNALGPWFESQVPPAGAKLCCWLNSCAGLSLSLPLSSSLFVSPTPATSISL